MASCSPARARTRRSSSTCSRWRGDRPASAPACGRPRRGCWRSRPRRGAEILPAVRTPNIGVSCNVEDVTYFGWTEAAALVPLTYVRAIARAGGRPLLLAPTPADLADPSELLAMLDGVLITGGADLADRSELLAMLDGVLITGGADLAAETYGAEPHPETEATSADRDAFELMLVRRAAELDLPCLGICRGMQVVNVAYGGALDQHLADGLEDDIHRGPVGVFADH